MALLELINLSKDYRHPAVDGIHLTVEPGEVLCLLGPSGCGKTTLLRLVAGLEKPDAGEVVFDGKTITRLPSHRRNFGLMFQDFALFPHKSVSENVAFGLQMKNLPPQQIKDRTARMLSLVGLTGLAHRNVRDLSGGEKQRVALARSLAPRPRLLMLDEPLGALDRALRERLLFDIRSILQKLGMTAIFVTHDQSEALAVSDRVVVMRNGGIVQVDSPEDLYRRPRCEWTARFLGFRNLIHGRRDADGSIDTQLGRFYPSDSINKNASRVSLILRPEGARLADLQNIPRITGTVSTRVFNGQHYRVGVTSKEGVDLMFDLPNEPSPPPVGGDIQLTVTPSSMVVIERKADDP